MRPKARYTGVKADLSLEDVDKLLNDVTSMIERATVQFNDPSCNAEN
jgi:hypothetical protein